MPQLSGKPVFVKQIVATTMKYYAGHGTHYHTTDFERAADEIVESPEIQSLLAIGVPNSTLIDALDACMNRYENPKPKLDKANG